MAIGADFIANLAADVAANVVTGVGKQIDLMRVRFAPTKYHQSFADAFTYQGNTRPLEATYKYTIESRVPKVLRELQIYFQDTIDATNRPRVEITVDDGVVFQTIGSEDRSPFTQTKGVDISFHNGKSVKQNSEILVRIWNVGTGHADAKNAAIFWALGDV